MATHGIVRWIHEDGATLDDRTPRTRLLLGPLLGDALLRFFFKISLLLLEGLLLGGVERPARSIVSPTTSSPGDDSWCEGTTAGRRVGAMSAMTK